MEYNVVAGKFGTFYVNPGKKGDGLDENDSACLTTFNTKYADQTPVMQFTGIKDEKGVEIFEGDILSIPTDNGPKNVVCKWTLDGGFSLFGKETWERYVVRFCYLGTYPEVVGNIYQNPELLTETNEQAGK